MEQIELETHGGSLAVDQALVLQQRPNLRQYDLTDVNGHAVTIPHLTRILKNGHLPRLNTLTINSAVGFKDDELSLCLGAMAELNAEQSDVDSLSCHSLSPYFTMLHYLNLRRCDQASGDMVQRFLV